MKFDVVRGARRGTRATPAVRAIVLALGLLGAVSTSRTLAAVVFGQIDDFEDGSTMGWQEGVASTNPPENVAGGARGADGHFLRDVSGGGFGPGSKQVMFNQSQWAGDFNGAHVSRMTGWAANLGTTPLHLRVALTSGTTQFGSAQAVELPADAVWRRVSFDLTESAMSRILGTASLSDVLGGVTEMRLLSAAGGPTFRGDTIDSVLAVDDLRAMRPEGDANFDGGVDNADLAVVRSNLGASSGGTWERGDFNFDGRVNAVDLSLLRRNLAAPPGVVGAAGVVPEPACGGFLCGATLLLRRTRRAAHAR
jgi:hypothetical protein